MQDVLVPDVVVRYQDAHLMIVEKPSMLASVPGRKNPDSLISRLQYHWPGAKIVHRLDVATSGLMVVALNASSHAALSAAFRQRQVCKGYLAVVAGVPQRNRGQIRLPLICDWPNRPLQKVDHQYGKSAYTQWRCLSKNAEHALVYLKPHTGRSHQLRVHLKAIGHPILGDPFYAPPQIQDRATRLLLHACFLRFKHPITGKTHNFKAPIHFADFLS